MRGAPAEGGAAHVAPGEAAFDRSGTRTARARTRRALITRLTPATVVWTATSTALSVLQGSGAIAPPGGERSDGGLFGSIPTPTLLVYVAFLYLYADALRSLKRIRRALEMHPWRPIPGAHRHPLLKNAYGVPIQLRLSGAQEQGRPDGLMSARGPVHRRR